MTCNWYDHRLLFTIIFLEIIIKKKLIEKNLWIKQYFKYRNSLHFNRYNIWISLCFFSSVFQCQCNQFMHYKYLVNWIEKVINRKKHCQKYHHKQQKHRAYDHRETSFVIYKWNIDQKHGHKASTGKTCSNSTHFFVIINNICLQLHCSFSKYIYRSFDDFFYQYSNNNAFKTSENKKVCDDYGFDLLFPFRSHEDSRNVFFIG